MQILVDTNVVLRSLIANDPLHASYVGAIGTLAAQGDQLIIVPQVIQEFWSVASRPASANGLGLTSQEIAGYIMEIRETFDLLFAGEQELHDTWQQLVEQHAVSGKHVHDARLVAALHVHKLDALLTADAGFSKYAITTLHPQEIQ